MIFFFVSKALPFLYLPVLVGVGKEIIYSLYVKMPQIPDGSWLYPFNHLHSVFARA